MSKQSGKIDFNSQDDVKMLVKEVSKQKGSKVDKIDLAKITAFVMSNIKPIIISVVYLGICGLSLNIYWIVKLIVKLF